MRPLNYTAFAASDLSTNEDSAAIDTSFVVTVSAQVVVSGTAPNGSLEFQVSNDAVFAPNVPTNWSSLTTTSVSVSGTGTYLLPAVDICYQYVRLSWIASSGTGALDAQIKTVGY